MNTQTYIIPRDSQDEVTAGIIVAQFTDEAIQKGYSDVNTLKGLVKEAVTDWVLKTPEGKKEWEESSNDFNIGDLSNCDLDYINEYLSRHGVHLQSIETFSIDSINGSWVFDSVLVNVDSIG